MNHVHWGENDTPASVETHWRDDETSGSVRPVHVTGKLTPSRRNDVDALLESLAHPLRDDIVRVRQVIRESHTLVSETVEGNAPAFRAGDQIFGHIDVTQTDAVHLVLKPARELNAPLEISGRAAALVSWKNDEEAVVVIDPQRLRAHRDALSALVRAWVRQFH